MAAKTVVSLSLLADTVRLPTLYRDANEEKTLVIDTTRTDGNIGIIFPDGGNEPTWVLLIPTGQLQAAVIA